MVVLFGGVRTTAGSDEVKVIKNTSVFSITLSTATGIIPQENCCVALFGEKKTGTLRGV